MDISIVDTSGVVSIEKLDEDTLKIINIHYNVDNCLRILNNPKLFENLNKL